MKAKEFAEMAKHFAGTAFVAFELEGGLLAIGRREDDGPICLYERDHEAEPEGYRRTLATFASEDDAARAGAFIASMGEAIHS